MIDRDALEASFRAAAELHATGRDDEAKAAYLAVLAADATHLAALTNLGTLLYNTGYRSAARLAYRQAVTCHPDSTMARLNLANALYQHDELYQAREQYEAALRTDANSPEAHQGLAYVLEKLGDAISAQHHRDLGYRGHATVLLPYRGTGHAIPVLLLVSALGGNVNTERFLDDRTYFTTKVYAEYYDPTQPVPFHAVAFNAIGDAELCPRALEAARDLLARTNAPVVNPPGRVAATGRADNARRLGRIPGVRTALTRIVPRDVLASPQAQRALAQMGLTFPLLLRTPGFHTGFNFLKADAPESLRGALAELPGPDLTVMEFLNARSDDGKVRKYRVMIVDGELYPLHLAISSDWKVHYFTAAMKDYPDHRDEERAFLNDMEATLGTGAVAALRAIAGELGLDYAGIDFAVDPGGTVLLFEANAAMMVPPPDRDERFAYRRESIERTFRAVRDMLRDRYVVSIGAAPES